MTQLLLTTWLYSSIDRPRISLRRRETEAKSNSFEVCIRLTVGCAYERAQQLPGHSLWRRPADAILFWPVIAVKVKSSKEPVHPGKHRRVVSVMVFSSFVFSSFVAVMPMMEPRCCHDVLQPAEPEAHIGVNEIAPGTAGQRNQHGYPVNATGVQLRQTE